MCTSISLKMYNRVCFCAEGGEGDDSKSKYNTWEAQYATGLAQYLMLQGISSGVFMLPTQL
jgi:hypothetical protein